MKIVKPKVWKIAETRLNHDQIKDWLTYLDGQDCLEHISGSDGEQLIELAGRRCYKSFKPGLNPNVTKIRKESAEYHKNTLKARHGSIDEHVTVTFAIEGVSRVCCFDKDTDVLTKDGWINWQNITGKEEFATKDHSNVLFFEKAEAFYKMPFNGKLIGFKNSQVDSLVTPNHRMYIQNINTRKYRKKQKDQKFEFKFAEELINKKFRVQKGDVLWRGNEDMYFNLEKKEKSKADSTGLQIDKKLFCSFLGWYISEGSLNQVDKSINIAQNKVDNLESIYELCKRMLPHVSIRKYEYKKENSPYLSNKWITFKCIELYDWILENVGVTAISKKIPDIILESNQECINEFLQSYLLGDGSQHKENNHKVFYTISKKIADGLQILLLKVGLSGNIRIDNRIGKVHKLKNNTEITNKNICYIVSVQEKRHQYPHIGRTENNFYFQEYNDNVFCVKMSTGILYVRRNGKPMFSGNTHEVCRHRAGTAFSQESLRYVRLNDIEVWIPRIFSEFGTELEQKSHEIFEETVKACESAQHKLSELFNIDEIKQFDIKKKLTSAFRRVAPEGLATGIILTANIRAWRHMIEMRTSQHAEEELRLVFGMIADTLIKDYPMLFGDFKKVSTNDGLFEYIPEFSKV